MWHAVIRSGNMAMARTTADRFTDWKRANEGVEIVIEPWKPNRTDRQHRFYWVYLEAISRESGDDAVSLHEYFKRKFLKPDVRTVRGETFEIVRSTTKLKKQEFSDYIERIAVETGIAPPDPAAVGYISNTGSMKTDYKPSRAEMEIPEGGPQF